MRVSDKMITSFVNAKNATGKAARGNGRAASGQAINKAADDPAGAIRVTEYGAC